ncbi:succinic semialdehyde dehydrogenase [Halorarius halobius]|uniref:succinic semialdehyde dehydrogenase n=1 Tax=Halorarius halobius TaxID=2962671 RepID=UPI0020CD67E1|nr:succinic semialdehyde dehydrogenase [Halorarius halobius]
MTVSESGTSALDVDTDDERVAGLVDLVTVADGTTDTIPVEAPFDGEQVGAIPACGEADVDVAVERAREAQQSWADRSIAEREEVLSRFQDLVLDRQSELLDVVQLETGKARRTAFEEVQSCALTAGYYSHRGERFLGREKRKGVVPGMTQVEVNHTPVGVAGLISPWNYPFELALSDALPALLAGNAVVLKPAEQTSFTALKGKQLLEEAGLPADLFQVVTGRGPDVGPAMTDRVDYVGFTGSTETGRIVGEQAGRNLLKYSLELGGKNPALVFPDADLDRAVEGLVHGSFSNAGQLCISIERCYVHEDVYDEFLERFVAATENVELGTGYDFEAEVGSLVSEEQLEKVTEHVEDAKARGATVHTGGEPRPDVGPYFFEPTILTDVEMDMDLCCEETFGPVVSVYPFSDTDEAIAEANDTDYGLNASVWTGDTEFGREVARQIRAGTVNVNEAYAAAYSSIDAPMGGMKDSGVGRRHGPEGVKKYTEPQTVAVQKGQGMAPPDGVPYWLYAKVTTGALKLFDKVPGLR